MRALVMLLIPLRLESSLRNRQVRVKRVAARRHSARRPKKGTAQAKEAFEKVSAATAETADRIKNSVSTAVKGAQDCNNKVIEFAQANTKAALDFVQKLSGVKSPSNFIQLSTDHSREQCQI